MRRLRFYILAIATVCAVACAEEAPKSTLPEFETFEYENYEEGNFVITISYERIKNTSAKRSYAVIDSMNYHTTFGEYALDNRNLQQTAERMSKETIKSMGYYNIGDTECVMHLYQVATLLRNNSIICYDTVIEAGICGMCPIVGQTYECYDVASGNIYDFSYLSDGEWYDALIGVLFNKLKAEYGDGLYIVSPEYLYLPLTTYLTDTGIVFQYNAYEIADAELDNISVELTDAELEAVGAPLLWK
jgi:hypothetical protein